MGKFFKIAANLRTLKMVHKKVITPHLIRRGVSIKDGAGPLLSKKLSGATALSKATKQKISPELHGKILIGRGGGVRALKISDSFSYIDKGPKIPSSPKQQEMINRVVGMHELFEAKVKKKDLKTFFAHQSPKVIFAESNLLASLPKRYKPVINFFRKMRATNETLVFKDLGFPNFVYGQKRIPKAHQKHFIKKYDSITKMVQLK